MKLNHKRKFFAGVFAVLILNNCASTDVSGNKEGSKPINDSEAKQYKKALLRCYKTGGSRIVKINGVLRCF